MQAGMHVCASARVGMSLNYNISTRAVLSLSLWPAVAQINNNKLLAVQFGHLMMSWCALHPSQTGTGRNPKRTLRIIKRTCRACQEILKIYLRTRLSLQASEDDFVSKSLFYVYAFDVAFFL